MRTRGLLRPLDLYAHGLPGGILTRLVRQGQLARVGRGLHALPERLVLALAALAVVACRHPRAVVCLLTALRFHQLTNRNKIGLDVALEVHKVVLREQGGRGRRSSIDEIWLHARLDRVVNVMRPYLEDLA